MGVPAITVDPVTFEILSHRLYQVTREMGATLERVGGSVNTTQMKDYIAALYRPNGDVLCTGEAMAWHVPCAGAAVRRIIERFERAEGIHPDDVFLLNDPYLAAIHQSDVYVVAPIHYGDRLAGWSATFVHVMDIGAHSPGGNSPDASEICHEGVRIPGIKLVEGGVLRQDVFEAITNMTRQPVMVGLDLKCEIAANNVGRARVREMYAQYGTELLEAVSEDMIRYTEGVLRKRLAELPDGCWSARGTIETTDTWTVRLALRKEREQLTFDFSGTDPQARVGINLPYHATVGACFEAVLYTLGYDLPKNQGLFRVMDVIAPEATIVNARYPAPVSLNTTSGGAVARYLANTVLSQMAAASERWKREVMAQSLGFRLARHAGVSQHGRYYVSTLLGLVGVGARTHGDGIDSGGIDLGRPSSCHNVEWIESNFPLLYLFRRHIRDGAGAGRFRGGAGEETALILHDAPEGAITCVALGVAGLRNSGQGMGGGYPAAPSLLAHLEGTTIRRLLALDQWPQELAMLGGRSRLLPYCTVQLKGDDVLFMRFASGGGYGDPLERDADRVLRDVRDGLVSSDAAEAIYGIVIGTDGRVGSAATEARRRQLRQERLDGNPRRNAGADLDPATLTRSPLQECLEVAVGNGEAWVRCSRCGYTLCRAGEDWTKHCRVNRAPPTKAGPLMGDLVGRFVLERLCCPSCAVLLRTEVVEG